MEALRWKFGRLFCVVVVVVVVDDERGAGENGFGK